MLPRMQYAVLARDGWPPLFFLFVFAPILSFQNILLCLCRLSFPAPCVLVALHPVFPGGVPSTPAPPSQPAPGVPTTGPGGWDWCAPDVGVPARRQYRPGLDRPPPRPLSFVVRWNPMGRADTAAQCQHARIARTRVSPWRVGHAWEGSFPTDGTPTRDVTILPVDGGSRPPRGAVKVEDGRKAHWPCPRRPAVVTVRLPRQAVSIWRQARKNQKKNTRTPAQNDPCPVTSSVRASPSPSGRGPPREWGSARMQQAVAVAAGCKLSFCSFLLTSLAYNFFFLAQWTTACRSLLSVLLRALLREPIFARQAHPRAGAGTSTPPPWDVSGCKDLLHCVHA